MVMETSIVGDGVEMRTTLNFTLGESTVHPDTSAIVRSHQSQSYHAFVIIAVAITIIHTESTGGQAYTQTRTSLHTDVDRGYTQMRSGLYTDAEIHHPQTWTGLYTNADMAIHVRGQGYE